MSKRTATLILISLVLLISSCAKGPVPEETAPESLTLSTETGPPPTNPPQASDTPLPLTETLTPSATAVQAGIEASETPVQTTTSSPFELLSPAFPDEGNIPIGYACHGADVSPPLAWSDPPGGTQSLVLVMDDPDAVSVAGYVWDHWLLFNIPADTHTLPEGIPDEAELTDGSRHGTNSFQRLGYGGPCPPGGRTHQYVFSLYALDTTLNLDAGATKDQILAAIEGHVLAAATYRGRYRSP